MIRSIVTTEEDLHCAAALIESDRRYFEMGAETLKLPCGVMVWMPSLTELAASCVVHRVDFDQYRGSAAEWIDGIQSNRFQ